MDTRDRPASLSVSLQDIPRCPEGLCLARALLALSRRFLRRKEQSSNSEAHRLQAGFEDGNLQVSCSRFRRDFDDADPEVRFLVVSRPRSGRMTHLNRPILIDAFPLA
jgi:hypothetical protein